MSKSKLQLPNELRVGETFTLCDNSWSILFAGYWVSYRRTASLKNVAKFKVVTHRHDKGKEGYDIEVMEIAPAEGRVVIPLGLKDFFTLEQVRISMASNYALKLT